MTAAKTVAAGTGQPAATGRMYDIDLLVTAGDIAKLTGKATQAVYTWMTRYPDFPKLLRTIGHYKVWYRPEVESWLTDRGADLRLPRCIRRETGTSLVAVSRDC